MYVEGLRAVIRACPDLQVCVVPVGVGERRRRRPAVPSKRGPWGGSGCLPGGATLLLLPLLPASLLAQPQTFAISSGQQVAGLVSVNDTLVAELASYCPRVAALELSDTSVSDAGLEAIAAAYGPQLKSLQLNYSRRWAARGVAALAAACTSLQCFAAAASAGLDDAGLAALGGGCTQLALVCVDRCTHVSLDGVMRLVNRCPGIKYVEMAGIHRQSHPEQQAAFGRWCQQRRLRYDPYSGLLASE